MTLIPRDILSRLLPLKWRGIEVPALANDADLEQGVVEHNQYGVSGGELENTCRKSVRYSFKCLFDNGIAGYNGTLYPKGFRDFWNASLDRTTGPLQHPEFGRQDVKILSCKAHWAPDWRGGASIDAVWGETIEKGLTADMAAASPITYAVGLAGDLEELSGQIDPEPTYEDGSGDDPLAALKKIQGAMLLAQLTMDDLAQSVERITAGLSDFQDQLKESTDPKSWQAIETCSEIINALTQMTENLGANLGRKKIDSRVTQQAESAPMLAAKYGQSLEDFFTLNPWTATKDPVPAGSDVFVYAKA